MMRRAAIVLCLVAATLFGARAEDVSSSSSAGGGVSPSGTFTSGDLVCGAGGTSIQDCANYSGPAVAPKGVYLSGNAVVATSIGPSTSMIYWNGTYSGTCTSVPGCFANSLIMTDTVDGSASSNGLGNLQVQTTLNSASVKGSRANFQSNLTVSARTGNTTNQFYVSANLWAGATANDGGGSGTERGSLFAINPQCTLRTAATFWVENSCDEHDFSIDTNSSAKYGYIYKATLLADNATAPTSDSGAFSAGMQAGATATLSCMLCTGPNGSASPLAATADFIGHHGAGTAPSIARGINFSNFSFSTAAMQGPNSSDLVFQLGTTGSPRNFIINSGGNGAVVVVGGASAAITARFNISPGTGGAGALTLSQSNGGTGGMIIQGGGGSLTLQGGTTTGVQIDTSGNSFLVTAATDSGATDATVCRRTSNGQLLAGSGTLGICLGTSSARYKHDIAGLSVGLEEIMRLRPVQYRLNADHGDSTKLQYGFLAEDGLNALPNLVGLDDQERPNTFDYLGIVPVAVKAIQNHEARLVALEARAN